MSESVEALESQYFLLRQSLSTPLMQSATAEEKERLRHEIVRSRTNYWAAINSILHDDDLEVRKLVAQLNENRTVLAASIERLDKITEVLTAITKAVDLGADLASKAIAL